MVFSHPYILKPSSNRSHFKLIISDQTLIKLKRYFAYICAFYMGKLLAVFLISFLLLQSFLGKKMQKWTYLRKTGFESSFYKIDV